MFCFCIFTKIQITPFNCFYVCWSDIFIYKVYVIFGWGEKGVNGEGEKEEGEKRRLWCIDVSLFGCGEREKKEDGWIFHLDLPFYSFQMGEKMTMQCTLQKYSHYPLFQITIKV